jgi:hypothetical protein
MAFGDSRGSSMSIEDVSKQGEWLFTGIRRALVAAGVVYVALLLVYVWRFGSEGLSSDQGHWGAFGDFIGGTLNPFFGLLSVVLLALTLREQRRILIETKRQALFEEYQRVIAATSKGLDDVLDSSFEWPHPLSSPHKAANDIRGLCDVLIGFAHGPNPIPRQYVDFFDNHPMLQRTALRTHRLVNLLVDFQLQGGAPKVAHLYSTAYASPIIVVAALWPDQLARAAFSEIGLREELVRVDALRGKFQAQDAHATPTSTPK